MMSRGEGSSSAASAESRTALALRANYEIVQRDGTIHVFASEAATTVYRIVTHEHNLLEKETKRWVSIGKSRSRELIFVDFDKMIQQFSRLKGCYHLGKPHPACWKALIKLDRGYNNKVATILMVIMQVVKHEMRDSDANELVAYDAKVAKVDSTNFTTKKVINLSDIVDIKRVEGECRHQVLMVAAMIQWFIDLNILPRTLEAFSYRDSGSCAHSWLVVHRPGAVGGCWLVDSSMNDLPIPLWRSALPDLSIWYNIIHPYKEKPKQKHSNLRCYLQAYFRAGMVKEIMEKFKPGMSSEMYWYHAELDNAADNLQQCVKDIKDIKDIAEFQLASPPSVCVGLSLPRSSELNAQASSRSSLRQDSVNLHGKLHTNPLPKSPVINRAKGAKKAQNSLKSKQATSLLSWVLGSSLLGLGLVPVILLVSHAAILAAMSVNAIIVITIAYECMLCLIGLLAASFISERKENGVGLATVKESAGQLNGMAQAAPTTPPKQMLTTDERRPVGRAFRRA